MANPRKLSARDVAVWLLGQVTEEGRLISELQGAPRWVALSGEERARAGRLAQDTLRNLERCDRVLKPFLRKPPPGPVRQILRLATAELCQGGDAHGVVHDAVSRTRARNSAGVSPLHSPIAESEVRTRGPGNTPRAKASRSSRSTGAPRLCTVVTPERRVPPRL